MLMGFDKRHNLFYHLRLEVILLEHAIGNDLLDPEYLLSICIHLKINVMASRLQRCQVVAKLLAPNVFELDVGNEYSTCRELESIRYSLTPEQTTICVPT